jgi:decaprenylphospho-beta-D-ribofuranose 2-oxidase
MQIHKNFIENKTLLIHGWGKNKIQKSKIFYPINITGLKKILRINNKDFVIRGLGRSYGDSSVNDHVISLEKFKKKIKLNKKKNLVECSSNVSYLELNSVLIRRGYFPIVTPGSQYVTIGGAVASDIHGKNHHVDGSFCDHVVQLEILRNNLKIIKCSKQNNKELFKATSGGMGLTGVILQVSFKVIKIRNNIINEELFKSSNLNETINLLEKNNKKKYVVAWIDTTAKEEKIGRGVVFVGEHSKKKYNKSFSGFTLKLGFNFPNFFFNNYLIKILNTIYYFLIPKYKFREVNYKNFFYPLDNILQWNNIYGKKGFTQYQIILPNKNIRKNLKEILIFLKKKNYRSFVTTLKLLGKKNQNYLSFPDVGFTATFDVPNNNNLLILQMRLEKIMLKVGGKFYLTKDSFMSKKFFHRTHKRVLNHFRKQIMIKHKFFTLQSNQSKRLGIL